MSSKSIWTCDRCGGEQVVTNASGPDQFWNIWLKVEHVGPKSATYASAADGLTVQVCRPCLEALGIYSKERPKPETVPDRMNRVEEIVRELIAICQPEQRQ